MTTLLEFRNTKYKYNSQPGYEGETYHFISEDGSYQTWSYNTEVEKNSLKVIYHREDGPAIIDLDNEFPFERSQWYLHGYLTTWRHVFAEAAGDKDKEARILQNWFMFGDSWEEEFLKNERWNGGHPRLGKKVIPWDETKIRFCKTPNGKNWWKYISERYHQVNYESEGCGISKISKMSRKHTNEWRGVI